jgi:hypothetical protein
MQQGFSLIMEMLFLTTGSVIEDKKRKDGWLKRQCHKSELLCLDEAEVVTERCEMKNWDNV